jgi:hypothetical protein
MKRKYTVAIGIVVIMIVGLAGVVGYTAMQPKSQTSSTISTTIARTSSQSPTTQTTGIPTTSTASSSTTTSGQQSQGTLAMQLTDPPVAASGVSSAVVKYNGIAVHSASSPSTSGWVQMNATGTINLMSSANVSQTIASAKIQSGVYNQARINITSGTVTYNNKNYTAAIASGTITATMQQNTLVKASVPAEAIIDLRTFVINSGNSSSPQFIISATAQATTEPPSAVTSASLQVGAKASLHGQAWWGAFVDQTSTKVVVTSATLTSASLNLILKNPGNASADVQTVIITPVPASASAATSLPASLTGSAVFTLSSSGTLQESNTLQGVALLSSVGAQVSASSSTTLSYAGAISLGFGLSSIIQLTGIVSGQQYLITCMGANTYSSATVVAQ